jgi:glycosyltransferase involved in cell wall biosynthesis
MQNRVVWLGEQSAESIRDLYAASTLVVLPTYSEGLPRVLLEAQAMKRAVVAYQCGGVGEALLSGRTGFAVPVGDVAMLADKIEFLMSHEHERQRMGDEGRRFVARQFSLAALLSRHESFYLAALKA